MADEPLAHYLHCRLWPEAADEVEQVQFGEPLAALAFDGERAAFDHATEGPRAWVAVGEADDGHGQSVPCSPFVRNARKPIVLELQGRERRV